MTVIRHWSAWPAATSAGSSPACPSSNAAPSCPTPADLDAWATATGASPGVRAELADLLTSARVEYSVWSDVYRTGGIAERQAELGRLEAQANTRLRPSCCRSRADRRSQVRHPRPSKDWSPSASSAKSFSTNRTGACRSCSAKPLWTHFGSVNTLLGQLDRLVTLAELDSVELGIVPVVNPSPIMPLAGFSLHDNDVLYVETLTDEHRVEDPEQIAAHVRAFDLLRDAAATGPDAVALIRRVAAGLR